MFVSIAAVHPRLRRGGTKPDGVQQALDAAASSKTCQYLGEASRQRGGNEDSTRQQGTPHRLQHTNDAVTRLLHAKRGIASASTEPKKCQGASREPTTTSGSRKRHRRPRLAASTPRHRWKARRTPQCTHQNTRQASRCHHHPQRIKGGEHDGKYRQSRARTLLAEHMTSSRTHVDAASQDGAQPARHHHGNSAAPATNAGDREGRGPKRGHALSELSCKDPSSTPLQQPEHSHSVAANDYSSSLQQ
ncbi:hypothetical protein TcBrA4_0005450 [Trypanosoma cruzi]|nr:hypothetical protein TcBrA4_0005450 [Trypanosoma cruzi]